MLAGLLSCVCRQSNQFGGGTSLFQVMGSVLSGRSLGGITSPRSTPAPHGGELELIIRSGASSPAHRHDDLEAGSPHPIPLSAPARLPPDSPPPAPPAVVRRRSSVMVRSMTLAFKVGRHHDTHPPERTLPQEQQQQRMAGWPRT